MTDRVYYRIENPDIIAALDGAVRYATTTRNAAAEFQKKHGAQGTYGPPHHAPTGLLFEAGDEPPGEFNPLPKGWRRKTTSYYEGKRYAVAIPDRRTKEGREIAKDPFWKAPPWNMNPVYDALGSHGTMVYDGRGLALAYPSAEKHQGQWIVGIPISARRPGLEGDAPEPYTPKPGMIRLKLSEYHAMKEADAEAT